MEINFPELKMDGWLQVKDLTQDQTIVRRKKKCMEKLLGNLRILCTMAFFKKISNKKTKSPIN